MKEINELELLDVLDDDYFSEAAVEILSVVDIIRSFKNPYQSASEQKYSDADNAKEVIKKPTLAIGIVLLARFNKLNTDYLISQNTTHLLLQELIKTLQCSATKPTEFWMTSDQAVIDKAKELGINILPDTFADLRYLISKKLAETGSNESVD